MSENLDIASRLRPIRLPVEFASFDLQDCLTLFGLGLLAGLLLLALARLIVLHEPSAEETVRARLRQLQSAEPPLRILELARLHAQVAPEGVRPAWRNAVYQDDPAVDFASAEADILDCVRARKS